MGLINFNSVLAVGVKRFDDDHCRLIAITNQLHEAIKTGTGHTAVQFALLQLADYADAHFRAEEELLEQHGYPDLPSHRAAHQTILRRLAAIRAGFEDFGLPMQQDIMLFLLDWLTKHVKTADRLYGPFLNSKGIF